MRVIYMCLVFLFSREVGNVHSLVGGSRKLESPGLIIHAPSPSIQPPFASSYNPCKIAEITNGANDAHAACHKECLACKLRIRSVLHKAHFNKKAVKYLYDYCSMVTEGKCEIGGLFSVCSCYTPNDLKGHRKASLFFCQSGLHIIRFFMNISKTTASESFKRLTRQLWNIQSEEKVEEVGMHGFPAHRKRRRTPRNRPNPRAGTSRPATDFSSSSAPFAPARPSRSNLGASSSQAAGPPPLPPEGYDDFNWKIDNQPEGGLLWTDVRVAGLFVIRAMLDTGSTFSMIHEKFTGRKYVNINDRIFESGNQQQMKISGEATINIEIRIGISVPLIGYVTDSHREILLGTDFFVRYSAKIRIGERTMEVFTDQGKVVMMLRFRSSTKQHNKMNIDPASLIPLTITVLLEGREKRIELDTGANLSIVNKECTKSHPIEPTDKTCSYSGSARVGFVGKTIVNFRIESDSFTAAAFVPHFTPSPDFIAGTDFIKQYIDLIDYQSKTVTLKLRQSWGFKRVKTQLFWSKHQ